jgi:3',5'-cyclic AMP phosphodiesterase CpdA
MIIRKGRLAQILPEPHSRIVVFGDIHGDLDSLRRGLDGVMPDDVVVFLGDYADRGPNGVEVIDLVDSLLRDSPQKTVALMGNHEDYTAEGEPFFEPCTLVGEVVTKLGSWECYLPRLRSFVSRLSLSAIVPGVALFVHGGIDPSFVSYEALEAPDASATAAALWSDPGSACGLEESPRGMGYRFGPDVTACVLASLGVHAIVRSHQPQRARRGPVVDHDGRVITMSSTGVYGGRPHFLVVDPSSISSFVLDEDEGIEVRYASRE